jgi:hypothetical protein
MSHKFRQQQAAEHVARMEGVRNTNNLVRMGDVSAHYDGKYEDDCLLGCCASETSVNFYQTTRCNILEDSHLQFSQKF